MATSLAAIRAKLQQMEDKKSGNNRPSGGDKTLYPFWNIQEGETAVVRFLPDEDEENPFFWVEKQMIKLPFPGVKGGDEDKEVIVQVPCMEMFGQTCPVLTEVRPMFNDTSLDELARKYWKKRSYIFQGFVQNSPFDEGDEAPENPIRKFTVSPQLFNIIKSALMDPDLEELPTDYTNGVDFRITKGQKGKYADYTTSKYSRKETSLTEDQLDAIKEHGLVDLKTYLPKRPTEEQVAIIYDMFQASLEGELYDPSKWADHFKPYGLDYTGPRSKPDSDGSSAGADNTAPADKEESKSESTPVEPTKTATVDVDEGASEEKAEKSVNDILAMVRNRNS